MEGGHGHEHEQCLWDSHDSSLNSCFSGTTCHSWSEQLMIVSDTQMDTDDYNLSLFLPKQYPFQILCHALPAQLSQMCCVEFCVKCILVVRYRPVRQCNFFSTILDVHALLLWATCNGQNERWCTLLVLDNQGHKDGMLWIVTLPYTMQKKCCQQ